MPAIGHFLDCMPSPTFPRPPSLHHHHTEFERDEGDLRLWVTQMDQVNFAQCHLGCQLCAGVSMPSVCPPRRELSPVEPHLHLPIFISMMSGCPCRAAGDCSVSGSSCCRQQRVPAATIRDCGVPQLLHSLPRAGAPPRLSRRVGGEKSSPQFCLRWIPHASISRVAKFEARESNLRVFSGSHDELSRRCPTQGLLVF